MLLIICTLINSNETMKCLSNGPKTGKKIIWWFCLMAFCSDTSTCHKLCKGAKQNKKPTLPCLLAMYNKIIILWSCWGLNDSNFQQYMKDIFANINWQLISLSLPPLILFLKLLRMNIYIYIYLPLPILFLFILHLLWPTEMTAVEAKLTSFCTIPAGFCVTFCYNSILDWIII